MSNMRARAWDGICVEPSFELDHYTVAPVSAHSAAMNLTILLEVATAVVLLVAVALASGPRATLPG